MSAAVEAALAKLYTDAHARTRWRADPHAEAERLGLRSDEARWLVALDPDALEAQAHVFAHKRNRRTAAASRMRAWLARLRCALGWD